MQLRKCNEQYGDDVRSQQTAWVGNKCVGDLVEFDGPFGHSHRVILTIDTRPFSNGSFATHEGALNYLKAVAIAKGWMKLQVAA